MASVLSIKVLLLFVVLFFGENVICDVSDHDNMEELKQMINNKEFYENLMGMENQILKSLKYDELKIPILTREAEEYIDLSNFELIKHITTGLNFIEYIIPTPSCTIDDIINFEHVTKKQLIKAYNAERSDLMKKKMVLVRSLKITKLMLTPMYVYEKTRDIKQALIKINNILIHKDKELEKENTYLYSKTYFEKILNYINEVKMRNSGEDAYATIILGNDYSKVPQANDLFFTTNDDLTFMTKLDKISNYFGLGVYNLVGSNLVALGHFIVLQLALRKYPEFFENTDLKFFSWQKILNFNMSDRFRALDTMCNVKGSYNVLLKRRKIYLKSIKKSSFEECNVLEFLVHYFNKYQMALITNAYEEKFKSHYFMEHKHTKNEFFKFMCNNKKKCNIYNSERFLKEGEHITPLGNESSEDNSLNAYNIYLNFYYFTTFYNKFSPKQVLFKHFLNLTGLLNNVNKAYVSSIYLPGYYNGKRKTESKRIVDVADVDIDVDLSFHEESSISDLFENLLKCVEKCNSIFVDEKVSDSFLGKVLDISRNKITKCNLCKGVFTYINSKHEEAPSMLQKFYTYTTRIINTNSVSALIKNLNVYEEYDNFLSNDIDWYTFLLLFRLTSYKDIANKNLGEAMYLSLKKEDKFYRSVTTSYWFPSPIKKAYTLYVRHNLSVNLVEKLESLLGPGTIEKMKKSIQFIVHVNSFSQLDFFHSLNEPPAGQERLFPLSMMLENKFVDWFYSSNLGYFFLNYEDPSTRQRMHEKVKSQRFETPKYGRWIEILRKIITYTYDSYFNQRHVKYLYKDHDNYNISNKIMLMRDSYELYLENYKDIIFYADIFNLRKYLTATPTAKKVMDRLIYYMHYAFGNSLNVYKYGIIYGFKLHKEYLKEFSDELFSVYKLNRNIFSDTSFLQSVYLLFRKIENSFQTHRRNDKISLNNIFFLNVSKDYSKLSKKERFEELNNSMASKFFSKALFSTFQIMFSTKLSNYIEDLDKTYGTANMLGLSVSERAFFHFAYAYYGSIMDKITNSLLPIYSKKPITQLKYGKTFLFSNYFMLVSHIYSLLNLNNLSLLCENQAIASSNYYSSKKMFQFIDKKFLPIAVYFLKLRIESVINTPNEFTWMGKMITQNSALNPMIYLGIHMATNVYFDTGLVFPNAFQGKLAEQTEHVLPQSPSLKPGVHGFTKYTILELINGTSIVFVLFPLLRYYAFHQNFAFFFVSPIRVMDRFHRVFESYVKNVVATNFRRYTTDEVLKFTQRTLLNIKKRGYFEESIRARHESKRANAHPLIKELDDDMPMITPQEYERIQKNDYSLYVDDHEVFEIEDAEEKFLNDKEYVRSDLLEEGETSTPAQSNEPEEEKIEGDIRKTEIQSEKVIEGVQNTKVLSEEGSIKGLYEGDNTKELFEKKNDKELGEDEDIMDDALMVKRSLN
ncbi:cytoadherence linked asexual protein, CLAG, putative [Plasmodium ovale curtisi]|uniref:Cytoadherence linked asexual protein, CLAG, putative n=1 Tax=Plasmodium ovale curtisi TaxID=864141 RepID=A0A1A8VK26_PLAOA|nr:cytoadherence linked asexual protein, CLAG, putative [Plasmodium ovale curtisi]